VVDFREGWLYVAVIDRFDESGAAGSVTNLGAGAPPPPRPAPPAAGAALNAVPATWNGDWALDTRPGRRALAIHDGRIFLVSGSAETETFPGTTSRQYSFTYADREVTMILGGKLYERYVLAPDGARITHTFEGKVEVYVRMGK
jgi:hypothetical protein